MTCAFPAKREALFLRPDARLPPRHLPIRLIELALRFLEPRERLLFRHPFNIAEGITLASSLNQADLSIENFLKHSSREIADILGVPLR